MCRELTRRVFIFIGIVSLPRRPRCDHELKADKNDVYLLPKELDQTVALSCSRCGAHCPFQEKSVLMGSRLKALSGPRLLAQQRRHARN